MAEDHPMDSPKIDTSAWGPGGPPNVFAFWGRLTARAKSILAIIAVLFGIFLFGSLSSNDNMYSDEGKLDNRWRVADKPCRQAVDAQLKMISDLATKLSYHNRRYTYRWTSSAPWRQTRVWSNKDHPETLTDVWLFTHEVELEEANGTWSRTGFRCEYDVAKGEVTSLTNWSPLID